MLFTNCAWSYGRWMYHYICNQCLSPLKLWVRIPFMRGVLDTTLFDKVCQWLVAGQWFSPGSPGFLHQWNWSLRNSWNIVESGIIQAKPFNYHTVKTTNTPWNHRGKKQVKHILDEILVHAIKTKSCFENNFLYTLLFFFYFFKPVSSTNETDHYEIAEILLKVA
jgi:hypothetical protein